MSADVNSARRMDTANITGKVVVITGASSGLGEATARHLAEQGAKVVLGARRADRLQILTDRITRNGGMASAVVTDDINEILFRPTRQEL